MKKYYIRKKSPLWYTIAILEYSLSAVFVIIGGYIIAIALLWYIYNKSTIIVVIKRHFCAIPYNGIYYSLV